MAEASVTAVVASPRVDTDHDALRTETRGRGADQRRVRIGGGIDGNLVRARVQQSDDVLEARDPSAHAQRNRALLGEVPDRIMIGFPAFLGSENVHQDQFIDVARIVDLDGR